MIESVHRHMLKAGLLLYEFAIHGPRLIGFFLVIDVLRINALAPDRVRMHVLDFAIL